MDVFTLSCFSVYIKLGFYMHGLNSVDLHDNCEWQIENMKKDVS